MQILNRLFKESVVDNTKLRVFDSEGFLNRVKELVGDSELYEKREVLEDFGENFAGYKGKEAVLKLLEEKRGQVSGAFYKEGLGDIDLVWGEVKGSGKEAKGYGLSKIIEKHGEDFKEFGEGLEGVSKGLDEIITKGEIHTQEYGRKTIIYHKNGDVYKVGLKQNWKGEPTKNSWVITSYKEDREADKFIHSSDFTKGETLPLNSNESIAQNTQEIKPLSKKDWTQFKRDKEKFAKKYEEAQGFSRLKDEISHQKHLKEQAERNLKEHYSDEKLQEAKNKIALAKTSEEKDRAKNDNGI